MGRPPTEYTFNNPTRATIYDYILAHPGTHLRELMRILNMNHRKLSYHLDKLIKAEKISFINDACYRRFYAIGTSPSAVELLRRNARYRILEAIKGNPGIRQKDLTQVVGVCPQTIIIHIKKMGDEIVSVRGRGSVRYYHRDFERLV
jgi:predicted transcriptional regulator